MKMKISILLGMISVLLIGCNITKDDAGDALNESTESLETVSGIQDVDAGEGEESSQPEVQDPQEENSAGGGEESSQPEVQDP
ncbi:MAG: hypothetical protein HFH68_16820, partial [Lachnospiraceae bacterium]|nr:hypothetical protein [Lachnospiraceae bacterium]